MSALRLRAAFVMVLMVCASALAHWMTPTVHMSDTLGKPDLETLFPKEFNGWRLDARAAMVLPSPETQALLDSIYNQTLTRTYINAAGYRIMLSVAYGGDQSDGTRAHVPEVCYPAQGFQITANTSGRLVLDGRRVAVRHLMTKYGARDEPITYWLVVGDRVTVSRTDQKLAQFRLGLKGLIPDGMLVRVSSIDSNSARGYEQQAMFLADLAAAVPPSGRDRVFGALIDE
ncbi:MAG: EpsI family protein [Burkholderiales bacterium]|nr:EpsI family protein [Burkholderiales bacterium]